MATVFACRVHQPAVLAQFELLALALAGCGAALGLFFAAALYASRAKQPANGFLAAFCACFAVLMVWDIVTAVFREGAPEWLNSAMDWVFLLLAPLFYFYVRALTSVGGVSRRALAWSMLPAAASLVWVALRMATSSRSASSVLSAQADFMPTAYTYAYLVAAIAQLLGYCAGAFVLARAHARRAQESYSSLQGVDLRWVQALILGAGIAALAWIVSAFVKNPLAGVLNTALPPFIVLVLGVLAQRQAPLLVASASIAPSLPLVEIPQQAPSSSALRAVGLSAAPKYAKSGLTPERMTTLAQQLATFMAQEKAFLESDLTLDQLAARTAIAPHQLSQVFNQHMRVTFFEYINGLRVAEVKRCLSDPAFGAQSVLDIGLAAGINSKAAFNAAFKRFTGTTPSAYRAGGR
jgi:AraC-like DNA-binding protein